MTDAERTTALQAQVKALWGVIVAQQRALAALQGTNQPDWAFPSGVPAGARIRLKPHVAEWRRQNPGKSFADHFPLGFDPPPPQIEAIEPFEPEFPIKLRLLTPEERAAQEEHQRIQRQRENERAAGLRLARERRFIYFVQVGAAGPIKIGITKNVKSRFSSLQVGHPEPLRLLASFEGPPSLERDLHALFRAHRLSGEWFKPVPELLAHIAALNGAKDAAPQQVLPSP